MPYKILNKRGDWLVQVQRAGIRKTKRGTGGEQEAKRAEALLIAELDQEIRIAEAARLLGIDPATMAGASTKPRLTLREYFETRWVEHAKVVQNLTTRRAQRTAFNYLLFYLGDKPLDALLRRSEINAFVEALKDLHPTGHQSVTRVEEVVPARREVIGYRQHEYECGGCHQRPWSSLPPELGPSPKLGIRALELALSLRYE